MKALKAQGIPLITFQLPPATSFYRVHAPKVFGDDVSARRTTVVEAIKTGKPIVGVEPGREALGIFGMTPIVRDGKTLANVDVGAAFGKEFVDRAKKRFGIDLAVYSFDGKEFKKLSSTFGDSVVATPDELKGVFDGAPLRRDADASTAIPPRSISGRSRTTPASRSACSKSSRTRPSTRRRRRVRSAT